MEWFNTFSIFETYTLLLIRYIFRSSIPKNLQFWPLACMHRTRSKVFIFFLSQVSRQFSLLKKLKNKFISGATFKNVKWKIKTFFAHFRVTVNYFWGPATSEKATLRHEIFKFGSYQILEHRKCSIFFKITPPYSRVLYKTYRCQ